VLAAILCAGILAINLALHFWGGGVNYYGHTSFSYAMLLSSPIVTVTMAMGCIVGAVLFENYRKNGTLKNPVAFGLTRTQIFFAQCLCGILTATLILAVVLTLWFASAELLLAHSDIWSFTDLLKSIAATYLLACANLITMILCAQLFTRDLTGALTWGVIWFGLPVACNYLALRFDAIAQLTSWLPYNFLQFNSAVRWWENPDILEKALTSGVFGILVFGLLGVVLLRKQDL
jgi:ABC-2 type transport system permease protein